MTLSPRGRFLLLTVLLAFAVCIPFPSVTVPEWKVQFVDHKGRPFAGLEVEQTWKNYSTENSEHRESRRTDSQGYISFPERTNRASMMTRILGPIANFLSSLWEASYGPSTSLFPICDVSDAYGVAGFNSSGILPNQVVLRYYDRSRTKAIFGNSSPISPECVSIEAQARDADLTRH
jgi:hypothetical protein